LPETSIVVDDFPIETSIYKGFPIAKFDYQRVSDLKPKY